MILSINHVYKFFGTDCILRDICATVEDDDRIGMIGVNGAGKSTLLRLLTGELLWDDDGHGTPAELTLARGKTLGYMEQLSDLASTHTVYTEAQQAFAPVLEAMAEVKQLDKQLAADPHNAALLTRHGELSAFVEARDGYTMDSQIKKILNGMGFPPETHDKPVRVLSGGERTRLALAKLLLQKPDLLILDEPTNHLDFVTMEWLEEYLRGYTGAMILVSHDRTFLDAVTNRIWEVENHTLTAYKGNYSAFLPQKEMAVKLQEKQYRADLEKAAKLQDYIDRNLVRASTTKMAQSRRKQLEKMEMTEKPQSFVTDVKLHFEYDVEPYNEVLTVKDLAVSAGGRMLVEHLSFGLLRGERLVVAGPNGTGKSTLLKVLSGLTRPAAGAFRFGPGVKLSRFEQQQMRRTGRVIDAIWDKYPKFTELEVRSLLARFAYRGEEVFKEASTLSGGELARLRFAEILLERPNFMLLDEPTNHLDIYMRETLSEALAEYTGTLILVTHDRYLMHQLACPILYLEEDKATLFPSYEALMGRAPAVAAPAPAVQNTAPRPAQNAKELRRRKAELRAAVKAAEERIEQLGADIVEMENRLNDPAVLADHMALRELCDKLDDTRAEQDDLYTRWAEQTEELEELESEGE
ncbi:MAG: ABC-F family ATP-binding cassette domain-containing protein [Oscillospiraceae bacterium]|nr:ABC-F family ATP-binding cassette domain-containing protein [Oscillospiraceae bacterium]